MAKTGTYKIVEIVHVRGAEIILRSDGILQFNYGAEAEYTMEDAPELEAAVDRITKGEVHKCLRVAGQFTSVDTEVMKYLSKGRGTLFTLADAFVIHSTAQRILANFYLNINKPVLPTKMFTNIVEAEKWLQSLDQKELERKHKLKILQFEK